MALAVGSAGQRSDGPDVVGQDPEAALPPRVVLSLLVGPLPESGQLHGLLGGPLHDSWVGMAELGERMMRSMRTPAPHAMSLRAARDMVRRGPLPRPERTETTLGPTWEQFKSARNTTFRRLDRMEAALVYLADCLGQGDEIHPR